MKAFILPAFLLIALRTSAQSPVQPKPALYDPARNAQSQIDSAVRKAKKEHKNVLLQVGGNWCIWCTRFHNFVAADDTLRNAADSNFVTVHLNYSPENKNAETLARLGFPQRFGFPVFVILDASGNRIHTQNSAYLEEGKGYSSEKVLEFFRQWSPRALDPASYRELR